MKTLIIDNYDSYTFNLYQLIAEVNGEYPTVICNDQVTWDELKPWNFDNIVISPGPGRPEHPRDFGICHQVIQNNIDIPLLGVCLGHQGIGYEYGGTVIYAPEIYHGRLSHIYHNGSELFQGIPSPFAAVRYHSLLVSPQLPDCLESVAWTDDQLIMGLRHRVFPLWGVQFHPESICTEYGKKLLENFKQITLALTQQKRKRSTLNYLVSKTHQASASTHRFDLTKAPQPKFELLTEKLDHYPDAEQVFVHLFGSGKNAFWLDSSQITEGLSRFSFMGDDRGDNSLMIHYSTHTQELTVTQSNSTTTYKESIFDYLKRELNSRYCSSQELPFDFNCGFVGYFGYELKAECGSTLTHLSPFPDAIFLLADRMIVIDHQEKQLYLICLIQQGQKNQAQAWIQEIKQQLDRLIPLSPSLPEVPQKPLSFRLLQSYQTYISHIRTCLQEIYEGETYQVCLTNQIQTDTPADPLAFYRKLRHLNPAPYSAFLRFDNISIVCSSPERFLKIDREGWVETKPIKGTQRRGTTNAEDLGLQQALKNNEKDRAENLMIVDLLRNDLGRVCQVGTVHVPKLMAVESYATVHQLVTTIRGRLRPEMSVIDCIQSTFPGGSMIGAPKIRTMQIIDRLEQRARGIYSGSIGFLGLNGTADLNIVIRTAIFTPQSISIGVGGGIVALSNPDWEFQEMLLKAEALIHAMMLTVHREYDPRELNAIMAHLSQLEK